MSDTAARVAQLKQEGNELFAKKDYALAVIKFSEAIALDEKNAILFANRAACHLNLKQYLDAVNDSEKAIDVDAKYAKAHARLATAYDALSQWDQASKAWEDALKSLPKTNLSKSEQQQREQYERGLNNAKAQLTKGPIKITPGVKFDKKQVEGQFPWDLAKGVLATLGTDDASLRSSAHLICHAREEFERGLAILNEGQIKPGPNGVPMFHGKTGALEGLSNGVLRDMRAFTLDDPEWIPKYNQQMQLEITMTNPWVKGRPEDVFREAPIRLRKDGWDSVRPAITTTIRGWIMRAFMENGLFNRKEVALETLGWAIEVLTWGINTWKDVPQEQKGAIFDDFFLIGVKSFYADTMMQAIAQGITSQKFTLEQMHEEAEEVIDLTSKIRPQDLPPIPGFISAFLVYPKANAFALKAYYVAQMAARENDADVRRDLYKQASQGYLAAADMLPDDEEQQIWYLWTALDLMTNYGGLVRDHLKLMERIRLARPKVNRIWKNSSLAVGGREVALDMAERDEKELRRKVKADPSLLDKGMLKQRCD